MVFYVEHKTFMIESVTELPGEWRYSSGSVWQELQQKFPDFNFIVADFYNVVRNTVLGFRETSSVYHKKGAGRPT